MLLDIKTIKSDMLYLFAYKIMIFNLLIISMSGKFSCRFLNETCKKKYLRVRFE